MEPDKQTAANYLLNLIADLEPRPHVRQALINEANARLQVLLKAQEPAPPAAPDDHG
jgi:hypothetical protein